MNGFETIMNHAPALIVAIPLLGAFFTPIISRINDKLRNVFVICILGITALLVFLLASEVFASGPVTYVFGSSLQAVQQNTVIRILFEVDGLSAFKSIISIVLAFVASIYSWGFLKQETGLDKYYTLLL